ncbi:MAG: SDR family NAD(P)-dependent oxidoreductase, partial [Spirochaetia bacterium]
MEQTIVVTGSTRGIGFGLAAAFLEAGHNVVICGRADKSTSAAVDSLAARFGRDRLLGVGTDVADFEQVEHLWTVTVKRFGRVHIWI